MSSLPSDATARKHMPLMRGLLMYFPDACAAVAHASWVGNEQHNPGQPLHWAKGKSTDHGDALLRHLIDAGTMDSDGVRHSAKVAWRALALLQTELENENAAARNRLLHGMPDVSRGGIAPASDGEYPCPTGAVPRREASRVVPSTFSETQRA